MKTITILATLKSRSNKLIIPLSGKSSGYVRKCCKNSPVKKKKWGKKSMLGTMKKKNNFLLSASVSWAPFLMKMLSLIFSVKFLCSLILMHNPMRVAKLQWGTVGLNSIRTKLTLAGSKCSIWEWKTINSNMSAMLKGRSLRF